MLTRVYRGRVANYLKYAPRRDPASRCVGARTSVLVPSLGIESHHLAMCEVLCPLVRVKLL